jgi:hypothetical protein
MCPSACFWYAVNNNNIQIFALVKQSHNPQCPLFISLEKESVVLCIIDVLEKA